VAEGERIGKEIGFSRRILDEAEAGADVAEMELPSAQPAVGGGEGDPERGVAPCSVDGCSLVDGTDEGGEVLRREGTAWDHVIPMDGEGAAAAGVGVAVGTKKRSPRASVPSPDEATP
jgi:hypothetical protein